MKRLAILLALVASIFVAMNVMPATAKVPGGATIENSCAASLPAVFSVGEARACGSYPTRYVVWCNRMDGGEPGLFFVLFNDGSYHYNPYGCW